MTMYIPVQKIRIGWCNKKGTDGKSNNAVIHALSNGKLLCGAKLGKDTWACFVEGKPLPVTCPKCLLKSSSEPVDLSNTKSRFV